jgi:hypothetical protein
MTGRAAINAALAALGERLAHAGVSCRVVVAGGAAMNLLGLADRSTVDVDTLALALSDAELDEAAAWVRSQDPGTDFHAVVARVVTYVRSALR